jgi:hypothetical protein
MNANAQITNKDCSNGESFLVKMAEEIIDADLKTHPENIQQYLKIVCDRVENIRI